MNNDNHISELLSYWLKKLDPEDRASVEQLWKEAKKADSAGNVSISRKEKDEALAHIKKELNLATEQEDREQTSSASLSPTSTSYLSWRWAAAAVILVAAGISYLFLPVEVTAPYGSQQTVQLPDDTRVRLNSGSTLSYNRLYGITHRNTQLEGEAYFNVQKGSQTFTVQTFNASIAVLGTEFNLRSWPSEPNPETKVALAEGKLSFQALEDAENAIVLNPGEQSTLRRNERKPARPEKASLQQVMAWTEQRFMFEDRPLYQIIPELERRFNITIEVTARDILTDSLTIYYSSQVDAEQIIRDICLSQGISYRAINNGFVIEYR
ncbi:FecR family protein [Halalkalibaculum sp. DA3122]|uniref:FecR family protein n=1 Tax=Halalkalibaculum sp. DA3122 TaxID=3373607 RepID=UPI0037550306